MIAFRNCFAVRGNRLLLVSVESRNLSTVSSRLNMVILIEAVLHDVLHVCFFNDKMT